MENWTATAVGLMHLHKITQKELANQLGVTNDYVSMILNGKKTPKGAEERINTAINEIIQEREEQIQNSNFNYVDNSCEFLVDDESVNRVELNTFPVESDEFPVESDEFPVDGEYAEYQSDFEVQGEGLTQSGIQIYSTADFGEIRAITIDGAPWFYGKDIAKALGYVNPRKAVRDHVDLEDRTINKMATINGTPALLINESGMYSLVLASRLPSAKSFKRWITKTVLPTIRQSGGDVHSTTCYRR